MDFRGAPPCRQNGREGVKLLYQTIPFLMFHPIFPEVTMRSSRFPVFLALLASVALAGAASGGLTAAPLPPTIKIGAVESLTGYPGSCNIRVPESDALPG